MLRQLVYTILYMMQKYYKNRGAEINPPKKYDFIFLCRKFLHSCKAF